MYIILLFVVLVLWLLALLGFQLIVRKYNKIDGGKNISGEIAAKRMLKSLGFDNIKVRVKIGAGTDKYDPVAETVYLSEKAHNGASVGSLYVAARTVNQVLRHANKKYSKFVSMFYRFADSAIVNEIITFCVFFGCVGSEKIFDGILGIVLVALLTVIAVAKTIIDMNEYKTSKNITKMLSDGDMLSDGESEKVQKLVSAKNIANLINFVCNVAFIILILLEGIIA